MNLLPGVRLAVAARFPVEPDWPARLSLGAGVDEEGGRFFPRGPWAAPTAAEVTLLTGPGADPRSLPLLNDESAPAGTDDPDTAALFQLPGHLRAAWWELLDAAAESGGPLVGFATFAARVSEFLTFKRLDVPAGARMEAVLTAAGARSIRRDPERDEPLGLGPTATSWGASEAAGPRLWGVVNLGDEDTHVVLLNLSLAALAAELSRVGAEVPPTTGGLTTAFLRAFPNYRPTRVRLGSGEGLRVPPGGLILDGDPSGKADPDMLLLVTDPGAQ